MIAAAVIFTQYIIFIYFYVGITPSLSDSFYELNKRSRNLGDLFRLFTASFSFSIIYSAGQSENILMILAASCIILVGVAAPFKDKKVRPYHVLPVYIGIGLAMVSLIVEYKFWYIVPVFALYALSERIKCRLDMIRRIEIAAFYTVVVGAYLGEVVWK